MNQINEEIYKYPFKTKKIKEIGSNIDSDTHAYSAFYLTTSFFITRLREKKNISSKIFL